MNTVSENTKSETAQTSFFYVNGHGLARPKDNWFLKILAVSDLGFSETVLIFLLLMKAKDGKRLPLFDRVYTSICVFMRITENQQLHCIHYQLLKSSCFPH